MSEVDTPTGFGVRGRFPPQALCRNASGGQSGLRTDDRCAALQAPTLSAMEELTDITSNSISGKDKIIASRAVDAIKDFVLEYLAVKGRAPDVLFAIAIARPQSPVLPINLIQHFVNKLLTVCQKALACIEGKRDYGKTASGP